MNYLYYPGCSLEGTAKEYDMATRALFERLGVGLTDIDDWTCCGASAAPAVSASLTLALAGRNLALAESMDPKTDVLIPCSACYLNLKKCTELLRRDASALRRTNAILSAEGLRLGARLQVRHLLDVLARDVGPDAIAGQVATPLENLKVAPYYGCQCLRPFAVFDDPQRPRSMEGLIRAAGAEVFPWDMGAHCCGASHMTTHMDQGLKLSGAILSAARGADLIVTVCPMCQLNLEGFQKQIVGRTAGLQATSILYLPQLLGLALGIDEERLGLGLNLALTPGFRAKIDMAAQRRSASATAA